MVARDQNGIFDDSILCHRCDNDIGKADNWLAKNANTLRFATENVDDYNYLSVKCDATMAIRFAVSVIYLASLSKNDHFQGVRLGKYERQAGNIAVGALEADCNLPFVMVNVLTDQVSDPRQFGFFPVRVKGPNGAYFIFAVSGLHFLVKFGGWRNGIRGEDPQFSALRVRPGNVMTVTNYPFRDTAEADFLLRARNKSGALA